MKKSVSREVVVTGTSNECCLKLATADAAGAHPTQDESMVGPKREAINRSS
jgi:hypothetical protein